MDRIHTQSLCLRIALERGAIPPIFYLDCLTFRGCFEVSEEGVVGYRPHHKQGGYSELI